MVQALSGAINKQEALNAKGPAAATIHAVVMAGWKPMRPDFWKVDDSTNILLDSKPFTTIQIIARDQIDLQRQAWKNAAAHEHGGGLETGIPSLIEAQNAMRYLRKHGFYKEAKAH